MVEIGKPAENETKPIMMLTHGYGAGCALFFRVASKLAEHFHLYMFDLIGMGCSGRPVFTTFTVEECEEYYVESFETLRSRLGIEKFYFAAHSFGGYMAGLYGLKYPERLIKLALLSPVGLPKKPEDYDYQKIIDR